jgi:hypothetical protein
MSAGMLVKICLLSIYKRNSRLSFSDNGNFFLKFLFTNFRFLRYFGEHTFVSNRMDERTFYFVFTLGPGGSLKIFLCNIIQHCFICGSSDSTVSEKCWERTPGLLPYDFVTDIQTLKRLYVIHSRLGLIHMG